MAQVFLGLGSNLGDRRSNLRKAIVAIWQIEGSNIFKESPVYETKPEGGPPQPDYFNQVIEISIDLAPRELLRKVLAIEESLGRIRSKTAEPRTIDIDILLYDDNVINESDLVIPHPKLHKRLFALCPLADIAPELVHPVVGKKITDIVQELQKKP